MKVLQICFRPQIPANDGGAIAMYNVTKAWTESSDVDLSLFVLNTQKHNCKQEDLKSTFGLKNIVCSSINTQVTPLGAFAHLFKNESYNISRFDQQSLKDDLTKLLKQETFDIVHFEGLFVSPLLKTVREHNPNAVCSLRAHNIEHVIWERQATQAGSLKKWYLGSLATKLKTYEDEIITKFDAIVPITSIDAPYFEKSGKTTFVNSTGVIFDSEENQSETQQNKIFHLGSLDWEPNKEGIEWFVSTIWDQVLEEVPNAQFYIAGKNMPDNTEVFEGKNIKIIGEVDNASNFMRSHGIMIVPLLSGSGMRIKIIEGMANSCPIISTSIGAEGITFQDKKDLSIANTVSEFRDEVIRLLKNPAVSTSMGKEAYINAQTNYSNSSKIKELTQFYSKLIK